MLTKKRRRRSAHKDYLDGLLDTALEDTFPASDPIAISVEVIALRLEHFPDLASPAAQARPRRARGRDRARGARHGERGA